MNSLFIFADILKSLARIESQINNLANNYTSVEERTAIDEALIDQFTAKANALNAAAVALKDITYTPPE